MALRQHEWPSDIQTQHSTNAGHKFPKKMEDIKLEAPQIAAVPKSTKSINLWKQDEKKNRKRQSPSKDIKEKTTKLPNTEPADPLRH